MQYGVRCMGKGPPKPMIHEWTCRFIRDGVQRFPRHSYGPFEFDNLRHIQEFFETINSPPLLVCKVCKPS